MSNGAIVVKGLRKRYGDVEAVRGVDLNVARGEVFALLGPNGAGKTTTVEILEGYRKRDDGDVEVLGHDPGRNEHDYKRRIGIVLQEAGVERFLSVAEVIDMYRGYFPDPRPLDEIIEVVGLEEKRDERVRKLSGGQQRRLDVAIGLAGDPELLFLDEPTTGFDPGARRNAWQMVKNLQALGKTIFLTTHYMDEAQYLADRVAVIAAGKIVAEGDPASLGGRDVAASVVTFVPPASAPDLPSGLSGRVIPGGHAVRIETEQTVRLLNELTGWALDNDLELPSLQVAPPSLEDVYLKLTSAHQPVEEEADSPAGRGRRRGRRR